MTDIEAYGMKKQPEGSKHDTGGKATGASPGRSVTTYWQGFVEAGLRAVALFFLVLSVITASIVVGLIDDLSTYAEDYIEDSDEHHDEFSKVPDSPELLSLTRAEGYFLIGFAFLVIFYEVVVVVLRCTNCSLFILFFLIADVIISGILAFIYLVTGAVAGHYASKWDDWVEFVEEYGEGDDRFESSDIDNGKNIRGSLRATCVFCILEMAVLLCVASWLLMSIVFKWYLRPQRNTTK